MALAMLVVYPILASLALFPSPVVTQSGDLNSLSLVLNRFEDLSTFAELITKYPYVLKHVHDYASITIVAPSNEAFEKSQDLDLNDPAQVFDVFQYHLLQGDVPLRDVEVGVPYFAPTLLTNATHTNTTGGQTVILNKRGDGNVVFVSGADTVSSVLQGDIPYSGGRVHLVDTVLVAPSSLIDVCRVVFPEFEAFLGALYQVGLAQALDEMPDVTVFAPSDAALQLTSGALARLNNDELRNILAYHVVPHRVLFSTGLADGSVWPSLANASNATDTGQQEFAMLSVTLAGNNIYMDSSQILDPDILVANGILHMVANVLNPDQADATPDFSLETQEAVFDLTGPTATGSRAPVPFTSNLPCTSDCPETATEEAASSTGPPQRITTRTSKGGAKGSKPTGVRDAWKAVQRMGMRHWREENVRV